MKVGGVAENVTVTGDSPVVDVKSSATETTISQSLLFSAPITRTAINVINYAPGVNSSSAYGGGAGSGNALLIDGVDTRDPSGGTAWTFYNYNVVEEYQFQGLGAPAEYGGFTGAVVNTITKSGGNRFSGLFDFFGIEQEPGQQQRLGGDRRGRTRRSPIRPSRRSTPTSRRSSAARSSRTSCSSSPARSASCSRPIRPAASPSGTKSARG